MSLFGKKATAPSRAVEQLRVRSATLAKQLDGVRADTIALGGKIEAALIDGDDPAEIEALQDELAVLERKERATISALNTLSAQITQAEEEIATAARRKLAEEAARMINSDHETFRAKVLAVIKSLEALVPPAERLGANVWSANEIAGLARALITDLGGAIPRIDGEVHTVVGDLLNGTKRPASVTAPVEAAPVVPSAPEIPTTMVISLYPLKWRHGDEVRTCAARQQAHLPVATAERAIRLRRVTRDLNLYTGFVSPPRPDSPEVIDLDDPKLKEAQAPFGRDVARLASGMRENVGRQHGWQKELEMQRNAEPK